MTTSDRVQGSQSATQATGNEDDIALELDSVVAGYAGTVVLRDVSLKVRAGTVTALVGSNGAGKTTLLKTASGLIRPKSGSVRMFGLDVTDQAPHRRANQGLCHIPEGRGIFRSLTVRENLLMQSFTGKEDESIERAAQAFPILAQRIQQTAGTLSGGQQQMLALARAYVRNPRLILVDEASLGLAPIVVEEIFAFLESLAATGVALLIVDQFVSRALSMANFGYVLRQGTVVVSGSAEELRQHDVFDEYMGG